MLLQVTLTTQINLHYTEDSSIFLVDATARTFRYLDPEEIQAQKNAGGKK